MLDFLLKNRERPPLFSKRWFIVWVKRALYLGPLVKIGVYRIAFSRKGGKLGELSILHGLKVNGKATNITVGGHTYIGTNVHIASHAPVSIGSYVCINSDVKILSASHYINDPAWLMYSKPIVISDFAWIATGATLLPGVTIGKGAVVGAGAVVSKDVPPFSVAIGNPAEIRLGKRAQHLNYDPVIFTSAYEAWIGRNVQLKQD